MNDEGVLAEAGRDSFSRIPVVRLEGDRWRVQVRAGVPRTALDCFQLFSNPWDCSDLPVQPGFFNGRAQGFSQSPLWRRLSNSQAVIKQVFELAVETGLVLVQRHRIVGAELSLGRVIKEVTDFKMRPSRGC